MSKLLRIFALGGNEVSPTGEIDSKTGKMKIPDIGMQWRRSAATCQLLAGIIKDAPENYYILTHGNGPQVGNILLRSEYSSEILHTIPLDICGANSQGAMGYMLAQLSNSLRSMGVNKTATEIVTQVVVEKNDPAFLNPTKYIGSAYTKDEAKTKMEKDGWQVKLYKKNENGEEVWRRVVPSPVPVDILEVDVIENGMKMGIVPIAVGGGGIPVRRVEHVVKNGENVYQCNYDISYSSKGEEIDIYTGVEAVIDKDLASSLLGTMLKKRAAGKGEILETELTIFTDVDGAKLNYQKPNQVDLRHLTLSQAIEHYENGSFPAGSMGPKMKAAINFIQNGGRKAYITTVALFNQTLAGNSGTTIVP